MSNYTDNNEIGRIMEEGTRLWGLLKRYAKLEAVDKLSVLFTILIVAGFVFAFGTIAIYCICMGIVKELAVVVGNEALSFFIVGGVLVVVIMLFVLFRKNLVTNLVVKSLAKWMFEPSGDADDSDDEKGGVV
ncbi:MAG: hypothetical protein NC206_02555 [Bacteroides sp.]|nr:hypothetical protein [Roseburia sp.]MCM1345944.1 hypothetical protein [Bacteroides sp.]MCM1420308.1 hypothetical protein [Bacteroides sp.]